MNKANTFLSLIIMCLLAACATIKSPPTYLYTLDINQPNNNRPASPGFDKTLAVDVPKSTAAIMSRNILYQDSNHSMNAYAFSQWSDTPNHMLANLLMATIIDSSVFKVVLPVDSRASSDYVLESTIYQFHQQFSSHAKSSVRVRIGFYLLERNSAKIVSSKQFATNLETNSVDAKGSVEGFNKAVNAISEEVIAWLASLKL